MTVDVLDRTLTQAQAQGENPLRDFLGIVHRRRWTVILIWLLSVGAAVAVSLALPPVYEAVIVLTADKTPPVVLLSNPGQGSGLFQQQPVAEAPDTQTLAELVKREAVRDAAIARLKPILDPQAAVAALSGTNLLVNGLRVQRLKDTELVRATVRHRDPKVAAAVINAVAESVIEVDLNARRRLATQAREFISGKLERATQDLRASETALTAFKDQHHDVSLSQETDLNLRKLADLQAQLTDVRLQRQAIQSAPALAPGQAQQAPQGGVDPLISTLRTQVATLEVELSGLQKQFTPVHPAVLGTQAKIEQAQERLNAEIARHQAALDSRGRELTAVISRVEQRLLEVPTREGALARLTRNAKVAEENYLLLTQKFQEASIGEGSIGSAIRVVDTAKVPEKPVWPKLGLATILGGVIGLMLGAAGASLKEQLDDTVRSAEDAERLLGAPVLGSIPILAPNGPKGARQKGTPPRLQDSDRTSNAAEAFRVLRTHILSGMRDARSKCLLVTSAQPREGKSTVTANLAISLAQTNRRVWLVDCDLRHPTVNRTFPEADSRGLSALLAGRAAVDSVLRPTTQANLECVVSGPTVPDPAELLGSKSMVQFVAQARDKADVILLDSPAVLTVIDAEVIGSQADGAVLVAQVGKTDRRDLAQTRQRLGQAGVRVIGVVLNYDRGRSSRYGASH